MELVLPSHKILTEVNNENTLKNIERAGRICYKSEDKITATSAAILIKNIIKKGHHSVLEHVSISVKFICDRGVSHELVRHRLASYSQESTRYCNYKNNVTFILPPWVNIKPGEYLPWNHMHEISNPDWKWYKAMLEAENTYTSLLKDNWSPQQARSVLPNSLKTEVIMTCNLREWRHVLKLRCSKAAHPQMRELMLPLLAELQLKVPVIFKDITKGEKNECRD